MSQRAKLWVKPPKLFQSRVDLEKSPPVGKEIAATRPAPRCQKATSGALYSSAVMAAWVAPGLQVRLRL